MAPKPNSATLTNAPSQTALHGIYFKMSALVLFCTMDAMVKGLGGTYGSFQLMVFRSAVALVPVAVLIWHAGGLRVVRSTRPGLQALRVGIGFCSMFGFFYAFPRMPLVDAYAISFSAPLFMVALSVPILREEVGWRRWTAVGVGFAGVLIMLDPFAIEFHLVSLVILAATFCYSLSTVLVRLLSRHDPDVVTLFWFAIVGLAAHPWPAGRLRAGAHHPGLAARPSRHPGAVRLYRHRARHGLRLPVVQGRAVVDRLVRPAAGHGLRPLHPPPRAGPGATAQKALISEGFCRD